MKSFVKSTSSTKSIRENSNQALFWEKSMKLIDLSNRFHEIFLKLE